MTSTARALEPRRTLARRVASSVGAAVGLVVLPKCPLCIAGYLVSLGVGADAAQQAAPWLRPIAWALFVAAVGALAVHVWRRRHARMRRATASCCGAGAAR